MESFEDNGLNKEPSARKLRQLLQESYALICRFISDHNTVENVDAASVSMTTPEAEQSNKLGNLSVVKLNDNEFKIAIIENHYSESKDATIEEYRFFHVSGAEGFDLFTIDQQPSDTEDKKLRPATPAEIERVAFILEGGTFGYIQVDSDGLDKEIRELFDE